MTTELDGRGFDSPDAKPPEPAWLRELLGDDFFANVVNVSIFEH